METRGRDNERLKEKVSPDFQITKKINPVLRFVPYLTLSLKTVFFLTNHNH